MACDTQISSRCNHATFAPKIKIIGVAFERPNDKKVLHLQLRVFDNRGTQVYETPEPLDGSAPTLSWNGEWNQNLPAGAQPPYFVNPLYSPYTLKVFAELAPAGLLRRFRMQGGFLRRRVACRDEDHPRGEAPPDPEITDAKGIRIKAARIRVRYHHIELSQAPWVPAEEWQRITTSAAVMQAIILADASPGDTTTAVALTPDLAKWLQVKLNELGYFAGIVDGDPASGALTKALRRYNHANVMPKTSLYEIAYKPNEAVRYEFTPRLDGRGDSLIAVTPKLITLLKDDTKRIDVLASSVFSSDLQRQAPDANLEIACNRFYIGPEFVNPNGANGANKCSVEKQWLTNPCFPIMARIHIEDDAGAPALVPEAVGPVRVKWSWEDQKPSDRYLPVETAASPSKTRTYIDRAQTAMKGQSARNNTKTSVGGQLTDDAGANTRAVFKALTEHPDKHLFRDSGRLFVQAVDDPADQRLGQSHTWFETSTIGGDNYRITAEISLAEADPDTVPEPAAAHFPDFRAAHARNAANLKKSSGKIEIWRTVTIAAYVRWTEQPDLLRWDAVAEEYRMAFVRLIAPAGSKKMDSLGLTEAIAKLARQAFPADAGRLTFDQRALVGDPTKPARSDKNSEECQIIEEANKFSYVLYPAIGDLIHNATADAGEGIAVVVWSANVPVTVEANAANAAALPPPAAIVAAQAAPAPAAQPHAADFVAGMSSYGSDGGVCFLDQKTMSELYEPKHLAAHEIGHTLFLEHWKNAGDNFPQAHDQSDENCIMSYVDEVGGFKITWKRPRITVTAVDRYGHPKATFCEPVQVRVEAVVPRHRKPEQTLTLDELGQTAIDYEDWQLSGKAADLTVVVRSSLGTPDRTFSTRTVDPDIRDVKTEKQTGRGVHYRPGSYRPHFCGKCNLKLRGWDISAPVLPAHS